jgi:hypothetical protein
VTHGRVPTPARSTINQDAINARAFEQEAVDRQSNERTVPLRRFNLPAYLVVGIPEGFGGQVDISVRE